MASSKFFSSIFYVVDCIAVTALAIGIHGSSRIAYRQLITA
jgi:hypothetical protein